MVIELVPKSKKGMKFELTLFDAAYYFLLGLALFMTLALIFTFLTMKNTRAELSQVRGRALESQTEELGALERRVRGTKIKLELYNQLLSAHRYASLFFDFLRGVCHEYVYFEGMELDVRNGIVFLVGETEDFGKLRQQILILRNEDAVTDVSLKTLALNKKGGIDFTLQISLEDTVFKKE